MWAKIKAGFAYIAAPLLVLLAWIFKLKADNAALKAEVSANAESEKVKDAVQAAEVAKEKADEAVREFNDALTEYQRERDSAD
jgi:hypothetical protein